MRPTEQSESTLLFSYNKISIVVGLFLIISKENERKRVGRREREQNKMYTETHTHSVHMFASMYEISSRNANYDVILFSHVSVIQSAVITLSNFPWQSFPTNRMIIIVQRKASTICTTHSTQLRLLLLQICSV